MDSERRFAYTPVPTVAGFVIALAEEQVAGWTLAAVELTYLNAEEADMRAQVLNKGLHLCSADIWEIIASSMEASLKLPSGRWTLRNA